MSNGLKSTNKSISKIKEEIISNVSAIADSRIQKIILEHARDPKSNKQILLNLLKTVNILTGQQNLPNIISWSQLLPTLELLRECNKKIVLMLDWDNTIVSEKTDTLLEPVVAKQFFAYLTDNQIPFGVVTGRYHDTVADDKKRKLNVMNTDVKKSMFPILKQLKVDIQNLEDLHHDDTLEILYDEDEQCIGIIFLGIMFGFRKGDIINEYCRMMDVDPTDPDTYVFFIDDLDHFLASVIKAVPNIYPIKRFS